MAPTTCVKLLLHIMLHIMFKCTYEKLLVASQNYH